MSSQVAGRRLRRFLVALALFTLGTMTLPGGPLDGERLAAAARLVGGFRVTAQSSASVALSVVGQVRSDASVQADVGGLR